MLIYFFIPVLISISFFCVSISLLVHLFDLFFLSSSLRYSCVLLLVLISLFLVILLFKKIKNNKSKLESVCIKKGMILFLVGTLIMSLVLIFYLPRPKIPTSHTLIISVPPSDGMGETTIKINRVRKIIDAPESGSVYVDFGDVFIQNGEYQIDNGSLYLSESAEVRYESYFSGCISVFFETSPQSHLVDVAFDQIEERYSLYSMDNQETEVQLCGPISIDRLSLKWQMIVIFLYISDVISIFTTLVLISLILYFLFLSKTGQNSRLLKSSLYIVFIGVVLIASILQIFEIKKYPDVGNENIPPLQPVILSEDISFHHIYQETLHTKKFSHSFIMAFLDVYPKIDHVYIHQDTLKAFNFNTFEFQRWFGVYDLQSMDNCPIEISDDALNDLILKETWLKKELNLEERNKIFYVNYLLYEPNEFILIYNDGNDIYLIPDSLLGDF